MSIHRALCLASMLLLPMHAATQEPVPVQAHRLRAPTVLDGTLCAKVGGLLDGRRATLYANGRLESCAIAGDIDWFGHRLPAGTWIFQHPDGAPRQAYLSRDTPLQGHRCRGTGWGGWQTTFHPNGALRTCWLAEGEVIDGVPCQRATFRGESRGTTSTVFREDGSLLSCRAAADFTRAGRNFLKGERVELPAPLPPGRPGDR
jgi:hypothetical protein